jgi:hypothetical protein
MSCPFIQAYVTEEIMLDLKRWKAISGMNYSMTVRLAVMEYLKDKLPVQAIEAKAEPLAPVHRSRIFKRSRP